MTDRKSADDDRLPPPSTADLIAAAKLADERLFERGKASKAVQWGLWKLHGEMVDAAKLFRTGDRQDQRDAIYASIASIRVFLEQQGFSLTTLEPLMQPVFALVERENNRLDPVFCERQWSGAPRRSLDDYSRIGAIAALADAWLRLHADGSGRLDDKLRRLIRQIKGPFFVEINLSRIKSARIMVGQELSDHSAVRWYNVYAEQIHYAESLWGLESAIRVVARVQTQSAS